MLVFRHLSKASWTPSHIIGCLSQAQVHLPHIYTPDGLKLLETLDEMTTSAPDRLRWMKRMYQKVAESARSAPLSNCGSHDDSLRLLIRALWDSARSQGEAVEAPVVAQLRYLCEKISDQRLQRYLAPILEHPQNGISQICFLITACTRKPDLIPVGVQVLACIPSAVLHSWVSVVPARLLIQNESKATSRTGSRRLQRFETWSKLLHGLDQATSPSGVSWVDLAFKQLARVFMDRRSTVIPPHSLVTALLYALKRHASLTSAPSERVVGFLREYGAELSTQQTAKLPLNEMLARLIFHLEEASLPNHGVLDLIIPVIDRHKGFQSVMDLLRRIKERGSTLSDTACLEEYMGKALEQVKGGQALTKRERQHHAFALRNCHELQQLQIALGARVRAQGAALKALKAQRQFQHIMDRANEAHIVPLSLRRLTADLPMHKRAELIHQFASQYSLNTSRSHRQNWRSIYYLYKYLLRNKLDIGPLFSKAVARVCIIQPLSQNQFVSSRRLIWVCRLVARVEGEDVARRIEHTFWVWRGDLILHAKQTLVACGSRGRAHVNTMKTLGLM